MKGMMLCRRFYDECVRGIIEEKFPQLRYSAGLLGFGSDVLGYDDDVSQDHDWGPRLYIFISDGEQIPADAIYSALSENLPHKFLGYPVGFGEPDEHGVSAMDGAATYIRPRITIVTFAEFLKNCLGVRDVAALTPAHWLAFSEHKLLSLQAGLLFRDELHISDALKKISYYPRDVWLYLIMSDWSCLAEERAFVKRAGSRGDDIGSRIICARLAHRVMHLCFLYEKKFAAYPKWFGTQFNELACAPYIKPILEKALSAADLSQRETAIAEAQAALIKLHNRAGLTEPIAAGLHGYYTREITVADSDAVYIAMKKLVSETPLANLPPMGSLSGIGNLVVLAEDPQNLGRIMELYR